ncbi:hypothetical protein DLV94_21800, partial [Shigella flexneri]|nr:hypothetical protein [Shigella flexneri]
MGVWFVSQNPSDIP